MDDVFQFPPISPSNPLFFEPHLSGSTFSLPTFQSGERPLWGVDSMQDMIDTNSVTLHSPNVFSSMINFTGTDFGKIPDTDTPNQTLESLVGNSSGSLAQQYSNTTGTLALCTDLPSPVPDSSIASPVSETMKITKTYQGWPGHRTSATPEPGDPDSLDKIKFHGGNPQNIVPAIQLLNRVLQNHQNSTPGFDFEKAVAVHPKMLLDGLKTETFLSLIDDVTIWVYNAAANYTRKQRKARLLRHSGSSSSLVLYQNDDHSPLFQTGNIVSSQKESNHRRVLTDSYTVRDSTTGGMISVMIWQQSQDASNTDIDSQAHITVIAIPTVTIRTEAAIHVAFSRCTHKAPMYTTIRTYNVVPDGSEIFECIEYNDLVGFRRLLSEGKASVTDVDEGGWSLLAVSPQLPSKTLSQLQLITTAACYIEFQY